MRILVTGGAGFIGSHLVRRLLADGHAVSVVDNEFNGRRENVPTGAWYSRADVTRPAEIEPAFARGLDAVCHIAGQVSIIRSFTDPVADLRTNVEGTLNVLQLCLKYKVPRLIYASSMTLYGDMQTVPTPETEPCQPDSYYGITKHAAERYVHATAERPDLGFDFRVTSLRMFSVYGPGQSYNNPYQGVLGIFSATCCAASRSPFSATASRRATSSIVDDIVDGWVRALNTPASAGGVFNLGSGRSTSINQLADARHRGVRLPARRLHDHPRPGPAGRAADRAGRRSPGQGRARLGAAHDASKPGSPKTVAGRAMSSPPARLARRERGAR